MFIKSEHLKKMNIKKRGDSITTEKDRRATQLLSATPDVFDYKSVLYIGAKVKKRWPKGMLFIDRFVNSGYEIDFLEPWLPNVNGLLHLNKFGKKFKEEVIINPGLFRTVVQGSAQRIKEIDYFKNKKYDVVFWWHGPEHIKGKHVLSTIKTLEWMTKKVIVLASPYGFTKQIAVGGNPFEVHQSGITPGLYARIGYKWNTWGEERSRHSNLLGWKRMEK